MQVNIDKYLLHAAQIPVQEKLLKCTEYISLLCNGLAGINITPYFTLPQEVVVPHTPQDLLHTSSDVTICFSRSQLQKHYDLTRCLQEVLWTP